MFELYLLHSCFYLNNAKLRETLHEANLFLKKSYCQHNYSLCYKITLKADSKNILRQVYAQWLHNAPHFRKLIAPVGQCSCRAYAKESRATLTGGAASEITNKKINQLLSSSIHAPPGRGARTGAVSSERQPCRRCGGRFAGKDRGGRGKRRSLMEIRGRQIVIRADFDHPSSLFLPSGARRACCPVPGPFRRPQGAFSRRSALFRGWAARIAE